MTIDVEDFSEENINKYFKLTNQFIDQISQGAKVLVHCAAGVSRSGCIVVAYLMWKHSWTFQQAWEYGKTKRSTMHPNPGFQKQLQLYELEIGITDTDYNLYE